MERGVRVRGTERDTARLKVAERMGFETSRAGDATPEGDVRRRD